MHIRVLQSLMSRYGQKPLRPCDEWADFGPAPIGDFG